MRARVGLRDRVLGVRRVRGAASPGRSVHLRDDRRIPGVRAASQRHRDLRGDAFYGPADPPEGRFTALAASRYQVCGVRMDGTIVCRPGVLAVPEGPFTSVAAGHRYSCGLRQDGTVDCWGGWIVPDFSWPEVRYDAVAAGVDIACGLTAEGGVAGRGSGNFRQEYGTEKQFVAVTVGDSHSCALEADGNVTCRGLDDHGQLARRRAASRR